MNKFVYVIALRLECVCADLFLNHESIGNIQDAVLSHLAEVGPLAVNVDASQWHSYTGWKKFNRYLCIQKIVPTSDNYKSRL